MYCCQDMKPVISTTLLLLVKHGRGLTCTTTRPPTIRAYARSTMPTVFCKYEAKRFRYLSRLAASEQAPGTETAITDKERNRNRFASYLKRAVGIIDSYPGQHQPFSLFLKQCLAGDRRAGAQDRRRMRQYCYPYFRLGYAFQKLPTEEKILLALYLTEENPDTPFDSLISTLRPQWMARFRELRQGQTNQPPPLVDDMDTRLRSSGYDSFSWLLDMFPFDSIQLSTDIPRETWLRSILVQPNVFLRIRPGKYNTLISQLRKSNIAWKTCNIPNCIQLPSATNLDFVQDGQDRDYVVQDYSSQRVGELFQHLKLPSQNMYTIWDCCAGSGGKSLLALDTLLIQHEMIPSNIHLTVSDKRASILNQLKKRFIAANVHKQYHVLEMDLEQTVSLEEENLGARIQRRFDLVIADVPCSGSGTWARTPEQLCCFKGEMLEDYVTRQRRILANLPHAVQAGGYLLYCTCSVFEKENEQQVAWFTQTYGFTVEKSIVFNGMENRADVLFASLMRKDTLQFDT